MSTEVQTMAGLDDAEGASAMRTPLYPIISLFGLLMVVATFLTWASADNPEGTANSLSASGFDSGGWGLSALIVGLVIAALGVLGYFWNPFSDPEAQLIAAFSLFAVIASIAKIADATSLFGETSGFFEDFGATASPGIGLWLVLIASLLSFGSAVWILFSRPRAEARLN